MLILTRRPGQNVGLRLPSGEEINISVGIVQGQQVKIGFDAPKDVVIFREELKPFFDKKPEGELQ